MKSGGGDREGGFVLLETVIAFVILSISLAVGVETITQSTRTFLRAGEIDRAGLILDGLASSTLRTLAEEGTTTGSAGEAVWRVSAEAIHDGVERPLFAVTIDVWPRGEDGSRFSYRTFAGGTAPP
jgi:general secretion pathway protein I